MPNQVTLTFAGQVDPSMASATGQVNANMVSMSDQVGKLGHDFDSGAEASRRMADGFDYASSQSSMLSGGIGDVGGALTAAFGEDSGIGKMGAEMERYGSIIMGVTGLSDLLLFATNNLKLGVLAKAAADRIATAAQWAMNTALLANPITWIIIGIVALIAVIVLIATKTTWFQTAWRVAWSGIKKAAEAVWNWLKKIPGWLVTAFKILGTALTAPFRIAFNAIARLWNSTIGSLSFSVPDWVPGIGGKGFSVPDMPTFHSGGIVPGVAGRAVPIMAMAGERVSSTSTVAAGGSDGWVPIDAGALGDAILREVASAVGRKGGSVVALGVKLRNGVVT